MTKKLPIITYEDENKQISLFDYQLESLKKFQDIYNYENHKRFYFGLKMGLGKTYASLQWFKNNQIQHFFIVTKNKNLVKQWTKNYYHIFKNDNFEMLINPNDEINVFNEPNKVYIMTYDKLRKVINKDMELSKKYQMFENGSFKHLGLKTASVNIIFDESQALKSHKSQLSKHMLKFNDKINFLSLLSGSAISNNFDGLYTQYVLLRNEPRLSYWNFIKTYFNMKIERFGYNIIQKVDKVKPEMLNQLLNNFHQYGFFKDPKEVFNVNDINIYPLNNHIFDIPKTLIFKQQALHLPDYHFITLFDSPLIKANKIRQMLSGFLYGELLDENTNNELINFDDLYKNQALINQKESVIKNQYHHNENFDFLSLNKPTILYKKHPKIDLLLDKLKDNENYVIFYNFEAEKHIIINALKDSDYHIYEISGQVNQLNEALSDKHNENRIVLAQIQAVAQGIDGLQNHYYNIIYYSLPYSYELYSQANARLYRQGQKNNVNIYYLSIHPFENMLFDKMQLYKDYGDLLFFKDIENYLNKYEN